MLFNNIVIKSEKEFISRFGRKDPEKIAQQIYVLRHLPRASVMLQPGAATSVPLRERISLLAAPSVSADRRQVVTPTPPVLTPVDPGKLL